METLRIVGGRELRGSIATPGAKNSCLKLLAMSIMASEKCVISNVPRVTDVETMCQLLEALGARVSFTGRTEVTVDPTTIASAAPPDPLVRKMRASVQVLGPLLARFGEVKMPYPGGCAIGSRPIDLHLRGLSAMGASANQQTPESPPPAGGGEQGMGAISSSKFNGYYGITSSQHQMGKNKIDSSTFLSGSFSMEKAVKFQDRGI